MRIRGFTLVLDFTDSFIETAVVNPGNGVSLLALFRVSYLPVLNSSVLVKLTIQIAIQESGKMVPANPGDRITMHCQLFRVFKFYCLGNGI